MYSSNPSGRHVLSEFSMPGHQSSVKSTALNASLGASASISPGLPIIVSRGHEGQYEDFETIDWVKDIARDRNRHRLLHGSKVCSTLNFFSSYSFILVLV
ncbi:unnamed protein product [Protopolystoma xenopodis]|uniref:Uncharacterized protein n=1 Tax=Protopolystoma xenopodis TaxID=117903 RepID=A0A3S5CJK6_9PLAT|nr:unnamed protein product [Protopolystoma xenopodis]